MRKTAFTLVEILITVGILGLLTVLIFRTYSTISQVAVRIEHENNVISEVLFVNQTLNLFKDSKTIDFEKYSGTLLSTSGLTNNLYLTGNGEGVHLYLTGERCGAQTGNGLQGQCVLALERNGQESLLTSPSKVFVRQLVFKVLPRDDPIVNTGLEARQRYQPGFWIFALFETNAYQQRRAFDVRIPIQDFYSLAQ